MQRTHVPNWILICCTAILMSFSIGLFAPYAVAQSNAVVRLKVVAELVVVREGRSDSSPLVAQLPQGAEVPTIGNRPVAGWWQVQLPDGRTGWVNGGKEYVEVIGEAATPQPTPHPTGMLVFQTTSGGAIYAINADGSNLRYLTTGLDPALSPDRQWVAFARWEFPEGLYIIRIDGSDERQIFGAPLVKTPAWSPDGTQIAFTYQHGGHLYKWTKTRTLKIPGTHTKITLDIPMPPDPNWRIGVVRLADGYFHEMYSHDYSFSPTWSPDGTRIAYASDKGISLTWENATSAVTRDPNTYTVSDRRFVDRSPAWSPDGSRIAFQYKSHDHFEIMVMNVDGSGRTQLTQSPPLARRPINSVSPTWSPDGSQIAYLSDANGSWEIWVIDADGDNPHPMFPPGTLNGIAFEYHNVDERVLSWK